MPCVVEVEILNLVRLYSHCHMELMGELEWMQCQLWNRPEVHEEGMCEWEHLRWEHGKV